MKSLVVPKAHVIWAGRVGCFGIPIATAMHRLQNALGRFAEMKLLIRAGIDADRPLEGVSLTTTAVSAAFAVLEEMSLRFSRKATFTSGSLKIRKFPSAGEIDANESR